MKLPKLENPLTNDISLHPARLLGMIGWVAAAFFIVGIGQNIKNKISNRIPQLDGQIEPLTTQPALSTIPQKQFY